MLSESFDFDLWVKVVENLKCPEVVPQSCGYEDTPLLADQDCAMAKHLVAILEHDTNTSDQKWPNSVSFQFPHNASTLSLHMQEVYPPHFAIMDVRLGPHFIQTVGLQGLS